MQRLNDLAVKYGSDKHSGHHDYCGAYEKEFAGFHNRGIIVLELGFGGYEYPERGGAGMRMWHDFFPQATVVSVDIAEKNMPQWADHRTLFFQGSQDDPELKERILSEVGRPDIIIDDASHHNQKTIDSFKMWFPNLVDGGCYVIEDLESSWWESHGGCSDVWNMEQWTTINMLRSTLNSLNKRYLSRTQASDILLPMAPISCQAFYPNICFIHKSL